MKGIIRNNIKKICKDYIFIENYKDVISNPETKYVCHHRFETHFSDGSSRPQSSFLSAEELKALDMYYNRPPEELIFMTASEHQKLHGKSASRSKKISSKMTGNKNGKNGKGKVVSSEVREKISKTLKENSPLKGKPSDKKGKHWKLVDGKRRWY